MPNHIDFGILHLNDFCSARVVFESGDGSPVSSWVARSKCSLTWIFFRHRKPDHVKRKPGAVLSLPIPAMRNDTVLVNMLDYPLEVNN